MATQADVRNKAAKRLGILGIGQVLQADIAEDIDEAYDEIFQELQTLGLTTWATDDDIPEQFVVPVVAMVAASRATEYGLSESQYVRIMSEAAIAMRTMYRLQASTPMGNTVIETY